MKNFIKLVLFLFLVMALGWCEEDYTLTQSTNAEIEDPIEPRHKHMEVNEGLTVARVD